jgi:glycerol-3-phosphate acyltransferase PlsY
MLLIFQLIWLPVTYLLGAVPFGLILGKTFAGVDPRQGGSRNIGATNVARLAGTRWGVLTLVLDLAKGFVPVFLAQTLSDSWIFLSLAALLAILGHMYSVFLKGSGGKGVATLIGVGLALTPWAMFFALVLCGVVIWLSRMVSLGSLTLGASYPVFSLLTLQPAFVPFGLAAAVLLFWKHRANIQRLARGEENRLTRG